MRFRRRAATAALVVGLAAPGLAQSRWTGGGTRTPPPPPAPRPGPGPSRSVPPMPAVVPPLRSPATMPALKTRVGRRLPVLWLPIGFYDLYSWAPIGMAPAFDTAPTSAGDFDVMGGVQLDVEPRRAAVAVDGVYVGSVDQFSGYYSHLDLPPGPHRLDIVAAGYDPLVVEVVVSPGRTTTYRGSLNRR